MQRLGHHNLKKATTREIKQLCLQIAREFHPEKIILFGSYAYGKPQWDSDVDLLVIMPFRGRHTRQAIRIRSRIESPVALDLLVRTPEEISKRLEMENFFVREIIERGKVMYEAPHPETATAIRQARAQLALKSIRQDARKTGHSRMTITQIDRVIAATRKARKQ